MSATDCAGAAAERPRRVEMEKRLLLLVSLRPLSRLLVSFGPLSDRELGALLGREDDEPMSCGRGWASQKSQRNLSFENGVTGTMLHGTSYAMHIHTVSGDTVHVRARLRWCMPRQSLLFGMAPDARVSPPAFQNHFGWPFGYDATQNPSHGGPTSSPVPVGEQHQQIYFELSGFRRRACQIHGQVDDDRD